MVQHLSWLFCKENAEVALIAIPKSTFPVRHLLSQ